MPERLHSDRSRVEQILVNLIGNALEVHTRMVPFASWSMKTMGDHRPFPSHGHRHRHFRRQPGTRLFQTFTQVHDRKMVGVEGTGLGLVISKRLAKLLGGEITVDSTEGEGSCFTLLLPFSESATRIKASADDLVVSVTEQGPS